MKNKDGDLFLAENARLRTGEDFGIDLGASPNDIESSKGSIKKKKKVGKKKSLIAPLEHPQNEPQ